MGIDSKGVRRGRCKRCDCTDFKTESVKCHCGHAPTFHMDLSSQHFEHMGNDSDRRGSPVDKPPYSKVVANSTVSPASVSDIKKTKVAHFNQFQQRCCYKCYYVYPPSIGACPCCYPRGNCENNSCTNMRYYDVAYGEFSYCSPSCRDQHLLPDYNKKLREHLESFTVSSNIGIPFCDQQIHKRDVKVEEYCIGSEPLTAFTTKVDRPFSSDEQELLAKYGSKDGAVNSGSSSGNITTTANKNVVTSGLSLSHLSPSGHDASMNNTLRQVFFKMLGDLMIFIKSMPKDSSCVYFYRDSWREGDKYGLYVTGLITLGEVELELGDLIISRAYGDEFCRFDSLSNMTIFVQGSPQVKIFRKHDLRKVREKIDKEVKNKKSKDMIVFLLPNKQEDKVFGIKPQEITNQVIVSAVDSKSVAGRSGIQSGDIIQYIGGFEDETKFTLTKVKKTDDVATTCTELKKSPSAIGLILIIKRTKSSLV